MDFNTLVWPRKLTVGFERVNYPLTGFDVQTLIHYTVFISLKQLHQWKPCLRQALDSKEVIV